VTPDLPIGDVVEAVRREVDRNATRARNGVKYLAGAEWAPVGPTPSDVVWQEGKVQLRRYRRDGPAPLGPPVVAFLGLVSRAYIFDLWKGNSYVQRLMDAGFDAFVLDWGVPDEQDAANTMETYVEGYLPRAIRATLRETGADEVSLIGYCMGGNLALAGLAAQPDLPVRNLVTMATPVDFAHLSPLADTLRDGRIEPEAIIDETGNVSADTLGTFFRVRKPTADLVQYANLWQNLWNDDYMEGWQAMGRWTREQVPFPGAAFTQMVQQWLRDNAFLSDKLRLGGRAVSLGDIRTPTLAVIALRDEIVPEAAAAPLPELLTGAHVDVLRLDAGHASLNTGRKAAKVTVPRILEWLTAHSEEVG
jgi:polyhydroxyalkanoate synthase subunit PhaC